MAETEDDKTEELFLPFDFFEEEKKEEEKKLKELYASLPGFAKPKNDNEKLLELQRQYRQEGKQTLDRFYSISKKIAFCFIEKIGRKNRHIRTLSKEDKEQKAEDAATYLIEKILEDKFFVIKENAPAYIYLRVLFECYYQRKIDKIIDFVSFSVQDVHRMATYCGLDLWGDYNA